MTMRIPFAKAEAVGNDFLIVEWESLSALGVAESGLPRLARDICARHSGVGADGLEVVYPAGDDRADRRIRIFNSDGSEAEISGNGTRAVAAYLVAERGAAEHLRIATLAGVKTLDLLERDGTNFSFRMSMGVPRYSDGEIGCTLELSAGPRTVTLVNVGNPQCVLFVDDFEFDWRKLGAEIEAHERFPRRTNVSFVKAIDRHAIDVRFWERGAGETNSSGTGSTGAAVASILAGAAESPVRVVTAAGEMSIRWEDEDSDLLLEGPATYIAAGEYRWK